MTDLHSQAPVSDRDILRQAEDWGRLGRGVAIATVVETFGSAPRPLGSHLIVEDSGLFCGSVSAGCVEGDVITAAQDCIADGASRLLEFGVADETAWRAGLSCGGRITVHVERLDMERLALVSQINTEIAARRACALVTPIGGGAARLFRAQDFLSSAVGALNQKLRAEESGLADEDGQRVFVNIYRPGPRLIIIGGVHVAQALAPMARLAGFDIVIVDPRGAYAAAERFPTARLDVRWPDEALPAIGLDAFTAVALLTHDPRIDDPALRLALDSPCFYVGALGSRATQKRRIERLSAAGVPQTELSRLRAPIGLDIAAVSPAEIAVSILSEVISARKQKALRTPATQTLADYAPASCGAG